MVPRFIDGASKFHTAKIIRQARCHTYSALGNCPANYLITANSEWSRYMCHRACFHVDEEGYFHSEQFKDNCGPKTIKVKMSAGGAHWQTVVAERHIGTISGTVQQTCI